MAANDVEITVKDAAPARDKAIADFVELAGLSPEAAEQLVDHALRAAVSQALETLSGENMVATSITMSRAERLFYLTRAVGRELVDEEIKVVFRCTASAAAAIRNNMNAVYASALWETRKQGMRSSADVELREDGGVLRITMPDSSTFEVLQAEMRRLGIRAIDTWPTQRRVDVPSEYGEAGANTADGLGLDAR